MAREASKPVKSSKRPASGPGKDAKRPKSSHAGGHSDRKSAPAKPSLPSKPQSSKERKEALRERKSKVKRNFDLIQDATSLWEELRRHDVTPERRSQLTTQVLSKIKGRLVELASSHTASRIVQACVKHGSDAERAEILAELKPKLQELSKSPYGKFVVSKLIATAPKAQLKEYHKAMKGRIPELVRHPSAAHVIDELYSASGPPARNAMAAEFYGREYRLFEGGTLNGVAGAPASLARLLAGVDAGKAGAILQHMAAAVLPIVEKKLVDCALVHRVLAEFMALAPASLVADAVGPLSGEALLHMVHTREGAAAACAVLAHGSPKDRKAAVRALKGHVARMALDDWGHLPLITALSVVDDTALLRKFIVTELQKDLLEVVQHPTGRRVVLQLLQPNCNRYLPPAMQAIVHPPEKIYTPPAAGAAGAECGAEEPHVHSPGCGHAHGDGAEPEAKRARRAKGRAPDGGGSEDEDAVRPLPPAGPLGLSKKDPTVRRTEVLGGGLGAALAALCAAEAGVLLRSAHGADVVAEVAAGGVLEAAASPAAVDAVHAAVAALAAEPHGGGAGAAAPAQEHVLESWHGSRALRRLALQGSEARGGEESAPRRFVAALWRGALRGRCAEWASTHAAKVLAAVYAGAGPEDRAEIEAELGGVVEKGDVGAWAARFLAHSKA
ncbi:Pumilio-like protein 24 [Auxenochlorella protothecoides]|uniref:Pumilio-like protein 24 n=1 Tax=Auxenochlorella protothecoides TaxID=3075 RepID=A0A087SAG8_AUXPR|nr:Pumilio-like protein 24 [Auxenochlorella protothecoides]KFM22722.1 Pumilio-like protein 24 [Auxenochlorella protothecoides]